MDQNSALRRQRAHPKYLLESDILADYEFSKVYRRKSPCSGEQRLMFAVLADAIECFQRYRDAKTRKLKALYRNAEIWIMSRDHHGPFSFENVCDALSVNAAYLRQGLLQWHSNQECSRWPQRRIREPLRYQYRVRSAQVGSQPGV